VKALRYTLLADGSSDRMLIQVVNWAIRRGGLRVEHASWAALGLVRPQPKSHAERARMAIELFPCDVLFLHRDAEKGSFERRLAEVGSAVADLEGHHVAVIPVRMTEAWFLFNERAIRRASGNPNGRVQLNLPRTNQVETIPDPKETLFEALLAATETSGRRREKRKQEQGIMRARVAELIDDFSPLEGVPAFDQFLKELDQVIQIL